MLPKLFYDEISAPCRAVLLTIKALNLVEIEFQKISLEHKEQLDPEFLKVNPELTLPTLVAEDLVLYDSQSISKYLISKFAPESGLYPKDEASQALVDEKLNFDTNVLQPRLNNVIVPIISNEENEVSKEKLDALKDGYENLDKLLLGAENEFIAGKTLTIADFYCVASISTASIILPVCSEIFPNLFKWYQRCKALPYYCEANGVGLNEIDVLIENKLKGRFL